MEQQLLRSHEPSILHTFQQHHLRFNPGKIFCFDIQLLARSGHWLTLGCAQSFSVKALPLLELILEALHLRFSTCQLIAQAQDLGKVAGMFWNFACWRSEPHHHGHDFADLGHGHGYELALPKCQGSVKGHLILIWSLHLSSSSNHVQSDMFFHVLPAEGTWCLVPCRSSDTSSISSSSSSSSSTSSNRTSTSSSSNSSSSSSTILIPNTLCFFFKH